MTRVTFKIERNQYTGANEPFAYFPDEVWDDRTGERACYAHVGQHSGCSPEYARRCRDAAWSEYGPLYRELVDRAGYDDLAVTNSDFNAARKAA